jgi:hypothetical protein
MYLYEAFGDHRLGTPGGHNCVNFSVRFPATALTNRKAATVIT